MTVLKRQKAEGRRQKWSWEVLNILPTRTAAPLAIRVGRRLRARRD
jgi:hypothetical protein